MTLHFDKWLSSFLSWRLHLLWKFSLEIGFYSRLHKTTPMKALGLLKFTNLQHCWISLSICENFITFHSNFPELHLACKKCWMWIMQYNWSCLLTHIRVPGSKVGEKLPALIEDNCCIAATDEKTYKPNTSTTTHDLQTTLAPKEEIRYWLPSLSWTWFRKQKCRSRVICKHKSLWEIYPNMSLK